MNSLFGVELPTPVNFVIAFVVVLALIGAAAWLVRRFGAARIDSAARGRQPRLAVIDSAAVDGRRKLVIIRRDNVEHLLMIGGPSDVVVETNIVRSTAAANRDAPAMTRNGAPDPTAWPLQPEPALIPAPAHAPHHLPRGPRVVADDGWQEPTAEAVAMATAMSTNMAPPPVRAVRPADTLAGLAEELARPAPAPEPVVLRTAPPPPVAAAPQPQAADQSLAEMAQRLEAALRRPMAQKAAAEAAAPRAAAEAKPARPPRVVVAQPKSNAQPAPQQSNNLEQEMASLLSRPGKT